ncbi:AbrB family transcriptional regulator [Chelativorans sp. YIM 93263]|nr:AbrB family transcriptional regulator [Chelativorans sp. YIM 93263]
MADDGAGNRPGSVTEMALTAKILEQGVAIVKAFHVVRIFIIIPSAPLHL